MDKRQELLKKLYLLVQEINEAKKVVDDEKSRYLNHCLSKEDYKIENLAAIEDARI